MRPHPKIITTRKALAKRKPAPLSRVLSQAEASRLHHFRGVTKMVPKRDSDGANDQVQPPAGDKPNTVES